MASPSSVTYNESSGTYSFSLPSNCSREDRDKYGRMVKSFVTQLNTKNDEVEAYIQQTSYMTQPKGSKPSDANIVRCVVYDCVTSQDKKTATVKYGGSVHRRFPRPLTTDNNYEDCGDGGDYGNCHLDTNSIGSVDTVKSRGLVSKNSVQTRSTNVEDKFDKNAKKMLRHTAEERYKRWPVEFDMTFEDKFRTVQVSRPVYEKTIDGDLVLDSRGDPRILRYDIVDEERIVTRQEQVLDKIKEMFLDKLNGGVSSRRHTKEVDAVEHIDDNHDDITTSALVSSNKGQQYHNNKLGSHFVNSSSKTIPTITRVRKTNTRTSSATK